MSFNLIPVAPLDGATVIGLFVNNSTALKIYDFMRQPGMSLLRCSLLLQHDRRLKAVFTRLTASLQPSLTCEQHHLVKRSA